MAMLKIDIHTHILPREIPKWKDSFGYGGFIGLDHYKTLLCQDGAATTVHSFAMLRKTAGTPRSVSRNVMRLASIYKCSRRCR